ncbi:MAG: hypothetical protein AAF990_09195 [Bacteroidota bacterium]
MHSLKFPLVLLLAALFTSSLSAQTASADNYESFSVSTSKLTEVNPNNWSFYADEQNQIYYIDFEAINVNLNDVVVKNAQNEVVFKDKVLDLPVNTIYEIDFSAYGSGEYQIELRSFTSVIRKEVQIR